MRFPNIALYEPHPYFIQHNLRILPKNQTNGINLNQKAVVEVFAPFFRDLLLNQLKYINKNYSFIEPEPYIWLTHHFYNKKSYEGFHFFDNDVIVQNIQGKRLKFTSDYDRSSFNTLKIEYDSVIVEEESSANLKMDKNENSGNLRFKSTVFSNDFKLDQQNFILKTSSRNGSFGKSLK